MMLVVAIVEIGGVGVRTAMPAPEVAGTISSEPGTACHRNVTRWFIGTESKTGADPAAGFGSTVWFSHASVNAALSARSSATGVTGVWVNGVRVWDGAKPTGATPGQMLTGATAGQMLVR